MATIFIILSVLFALSCVALFMALRASRSEVARLNEELQNSHKNREAAQEEVKSSMVQMAELNAQLRAATKSEEDQQRREQQMSNQFKNLATEIFKDHSQQFKQSNKESIDLLLKPFKNDITSFRERVETIYNFESEQRGALKSELEQLMKLNNKITSETQNLTNALKGNSKVQGDWGEMILETILESSNLVKGMHYTTQHNFKGEEGNNLRPDVVVNLPGGKRIIIDSKCSLTAYARYVEMQGADTEGSEGRKNALEAHILSVRKHIKELADKEYQKMVGSPDFVVMFVPNEPAFLAALQGDSSLWSEAYRSRVIISSPTNLFALLKLVDDQWKRDAQDKNTQKIMEQGTKLYEKLVLFTESLEGMGDGLGKAQSKYDEAYGRFVSGRGNLVGIGREFKRLGISAKREFAERIQRDSELTLELDQSEESEDLSRSLEESKALTEGNL